MENSSQIVTLKESLTKYSATGFFDSIGAIERFFDNIESTIKKLDDNSLLDLHATIGHLEKKSWFTRCLILEEMESRIKLRLGKKFLSVEEFSQHVARPIELAKSQAYEDLQILSAVRSSELTPRLDRNFYKIALSAPDFKKAISYAEEQNDSLGGKYSSGEFARWVGLNGHKELKKFWLTSDEIELVVDGLEDLRSLNDDTEKIDELLKKFI